MLKYFSIFNSLFKSLCLLVLTTFISGCVGGLWTGASLAYDRHNVYNKLTDYGLTDAATRALFADKLFRNEQCTLDVAVFNGDVLIVGHVPSVEMRDEANQRLRQVTGYRRLFNHITVSRNPSNNIPDMWITTKIRSQIIADDAINPKAFKIVTADGVVYIMGDVHKEQADKVVNIARRTEGVVRVVKMLKYFTYQ